MEQPSRIRIGTSVVLLILFTSLSGGIALADGLKSKGKMRIPQPSGIELKAGERLFQSLDTSGATTPASDEEKIGIVVRRNLRLRQRRIKIQAAVETMTVPNTPANHVDRERLIRRGNTELQSSCMKLHTHERAICLRDEQLKRMVRFQPATLRVGRK